MSSANNNNTIDTLLESTTSSAFNKESASLNGDFSIAASLAPTMFGASLIGSAQNRQILSGSDKGHVLAKPQGMIHNGISKRLEQQEQNEKDEIEAKFKEKERKLKEKRLKLKEKEEREKARNEHKRNRDARAEDESGRDELILSDPICQETDVDNPSLCQSKYSSTGKPCNMPNVDGECCAVHRDMRKITLPVLRCVCRMRGKGQPCPNDAVAGLELQFCSRHYKIDVIGPQDDNEKRAAMSKHLGYQMKEEQFKKMEMIRLRNLEHLQSMGQNISSTRIIPEVALVDYYAPIAKRVAFGIDDKPTTGSVPK